MTDALIEEIEVFLRLTAMKPTTFSVRATGDRHFVRQLRKGRRVWPETAERVRTYMRDEAQRRANSGAQ